jgi:nucleotide-binding universal stress UspA family protein
MYKVLVAVDDTKASKAVISTFHNLVKRPEVVVLLHVERLAGRSLMIDMLGEAEMSTLKESMEGTDYKEALDKRADRILDYYRREFEGDAAAGVTTVIRSGRPAEEILKVAEEQGVDLILLGHNGRKGLNRLISGSVAEDVRKSAKVPVLVAQRPLMCEEPYSWRDAVAAVTVTTAIVLGLFILGEILQRGTFIH